MFKFLNPQRHTYQRIERYFSFYPEFMKLMQFVLQMKIMKISHFVKSYSAVSIETYGDKNNAIGKVKKLIELSLSIFILV